MVNRKKAAGALAGLGAAALMVVTAGCGVGSTSHHDMHVTTQHGSSSTPADVRACNTIASWQGHHSWGWDSVQINNLLVSDPNMSASLKNGLALLAESHAVMGTHQLYKDCQKAYR